MGLRQWLSRSARGQQTNNSSSAPLVGSAQDVVPLVPVAPMVPVPGNEKLTTSQMTPEQLRARRMRIIEGAKVGRPFHEQVMLVGLKGWLLLGPVAFVALTASEVAYILSHLVAPGDTFAQYTIWGGAFFIELAMMFTTYGVAVKRRDLADKKDAYGSVDPSEQRAVTLGTFMWLAFAVINIISQCAFLFSIVLAGHDKNIELLVVFIVSRVVGFILGDAGTAFFLGGIDNDIKLVARAEREKGKLYADLAASEGERKRIEAKAETDIKLMEIKVKQEEQDADFLADLKKQTFTRVLQVQNQVLPGAPGAQGQLAAPDADAPLTGEFQTLNATGEMVGADGRNQVKMRRLH